ncbi:hypothetical protein ABMA70_08980 [Halobacteriovorax sp. XZX-3]|uniref:hypothetical protein n=1 Tax=unclassified Halobacteriovorax TaxID=2639665 RepID=UPI001304B65A|nr:hypothetical protein [Halobacteriovorax sp. DA5]
MSSKFLLFFTTFALTSCGVKTAPKPKNDNFPSFIEQNKKVLRPKSQLKSKSSDEDSKKESKKSSN